MSFGEIRLVIRGLTIYSAEGVLFQVLAHISLIAVIDCCIEFDTRYLGSGVRRLLFLLHRSFQDIADYQSRVLNFEYFDTGGGVGFFLLLYVICSWVSCLKRVVGCVLE